MAADEPGRAAQRRDRLLALAIRAENRDVDPRRAQIGEHLDAGDGPESEPRIVDLGADDVDYLFAVEELDLVADLEIIEAFQAQAALVAGRHLADVILEALEGLHRPLVDHGAAAQHAGAAV